MVARSSCQLCQPVWKRQIDEYSLELVAAIGCFPNAGGGSCIRSKEHCDIIIFDENTMRKDCMSYRKRGQFEPIHFKRISRTIPVSYTHLRAHETPEHL